MSGRIAWSLFGLSVLLAAAAFALWVPTRSLDVSEVTTNRASEPTGMLAFLCYAAVGALIAQLAAAFNARTSAATSSSSL